jgi:hypothetical protein
MSQYKVMFQEISPAELRTVEGGRSWLGRAWDWIKAHVTVTGHYGGGDNNVTVTVSGP